MFGPPKRSDPRDLKINLAAPPNWTFSPGDNIIGTVVREASLVTPDATIRLSLRGIAETRIRIHYGNQSQQRVSRWDLLDPRPNELFKGPLHLAEGSAECFNIPFEVKIPSGPSLTQITRRKNESSYLPVDHDSVAEHTLPGTFFGSSDEGSSGMIKYTLEAELRYSRGGQSITHTDTCPIVIRHTLVDPPLVHYEMNHHSKTARMKSHRLVAGTSHLSLTQKMQNFYGSSKVPELTYRLEIAAPKAVQLDHSVPIPLTVNIVGVPDRTSQALQDTAVTVTVQSIRVSLTSMTSVYIRGDSSPQSYVAYWRSAHSVDISQRSFQSPVQFHIGQDRSPFDIGSMCQLFVGTDGVRTGPRRENWFGTFVRSVYPDFVSYITRHKHELNWELSLSIAGEQQKVTGEAPVKVMPAD